MKKRVSFIIPKKASEEIRECMIKEGYGLREKSKWVSEAIEGFLNLEDYHSLVEISSLVDDFDKVENIYISAELEEKINEAIESVRRNFPMLEGVKSLIVRASIVRRLILDREKTVK